VAIQVVGVVGAGVMGTGTAQNLAQTGHRVILLDLTEASAERARQEILRQLRLQGFFGKQAGSEQPATVIDRIAFATDYTLLHDVDFVIENVSERWLLKQEVLARIDAIIPPACVIGCNTSAIPITRLASATRRPAQVIGMHFMNPVPRKPLVEVIRGYHTSDSTLALARQLLAAMGKECIVVADSPGFVSNRVLMLTINEAVCLLQERVASAEEIDTIFKTCFGHAMGPLETADLIGLDTVLLSIEVLYESFGDARFRPSPLLRKLVDAGLYGRKSGQGFYSYAGA
jgi:3-hydroxybutyryl-CoA dehydrogenase